MVSSASSQGRNTQATHSAAVTVLDRYVSSWASFSFADYEPLLHPDFTFTPVASKGGRQSSWDRETEVEIARDMFEGAEGGLPRLRVWDASYKVVSTRESWEVPGGIEVLCDFSIDIERDGKAWHSSNRSFLLLVPSTANDQYQVLRWTELEAT